MAIALASMACDAGPFRNQATAGPPIHVAPSGSNIGPGVTYTLDQPIIIAFDRFLNPATVIRQSVQLQDSGGNTLTNPLIAYDPVRLTVTLSNPGKPSDWLRAGQQYRVFLPVPSTEGGSPDGLLAIDGASMAMPTTILFTANVAATPPAPSAPAVHYCPDIEPWMTGKCNSCHTSPYMVPPGDAGSIPNGPDGSEYLPYDGLVLGTIPGIQATAIGQVANGSNTGPTSTVQSLPATAPFGIDMPIIDPGSPGNSWLLYKVLLATPSTVDDGYAPTCAAAVGQGGSPISDEERGRLSNYILGNLMPYPHPPAEGGPFPFRTPLTMAELERLSLWIAQGAGFDSHDVSAVSGGTCSTCP